MGKKNRHSKDKLFITAAEWSSEYGGKKIAGVGGGIRALPFDHCALSLAPFETPVCTSEGVIFDLVNLVPYIRKYNSNPITGEAMSSQDIIRLNMEKNSEGFWHCPVTCKVFNNTSHVVAIRTTGNVFAFDAVNELNLKAKNMTDLLTDIPFKKSDIITLQDPQNAEHLALRDINSFIHLKKVREDNAKAKNLESKVRSNPTSVNVMRELELKRTENAEAEMKKRKLAEERRLLASQEEAKDVAELLKLQATTEDVTPGQINTSGQAGSSLTSSSAECWTSNSIRMASADELREARWKKLRQVGKKGFVQLQTSHGNINLELHCDWAQKTCWNFITLCQQGYYDGTIFHRLVADFMVQGGDPTGTGGGGESAWGKPFRDEFDSRLTHSSRGVLSMANSGPNSNGSQFFLMFKAAPHLDNRHAVFGRVVGGMQTLDRIEAVGGDKKEKPLCEVKLLKAVVFTTPYEEAEALLVADIQANMSKRIREAPSSALPSFATTSSSSSGSGSSSGSVLGGEVVRSLTASSSSSSLAGSSSVAVQALSRSSAVDVGHSSALVGTSSQSTVRTTSAAGGAGGGSNSSVAVGGSGGIARGLPALKSAVAAKSGRSQADAVAAFLRSQEAATEVGKKRPRAGIGGSDFSSW